jgi:hypothetical protein
MFYIPTINAIPTDHILWKYISWNTFPSILHTPGTYMSIKLIATKTIYSQALSMIHLWADLLWMPVYKHKHSALYESEIVWCRFLQNGHIPLHVLAQTFSTHMSERGWHRFFQNIHSPPRTCIFQSAFVERIASDLCASPHVQRWLHSKVTMLLQGGYLVEPSAGIFFHAPTFGEHVNQATTLPPPQKTSAPQPDSTNLLFMSCLPSSSARNLEKIYKHWAAKQKWNCQNTCFLKLYLLEKLHSSLLLLSCLGTYLCRDSTIRQLFMEWKSSCSFASFVCSMKNCPIVLSLVPLQPVLVALQKGGVRWCRSHSVSCVFVCSRSGHQRDGSLSLYQMLLED